MNESKIITVNRKQSHVETCLNRNVGFDSKTTGFERYEFTHNAAPEINHSEINLSTNIFGHRVSFPFMISSMTGGYDKAEHLNRTLAQTAEKLNIPLGVGSMRQALENTSYRESFSVVRQAAPSVPVLANIGAPEVSQGLTDKELSILIDMIDADGLIVHLNPAQELFQPEGNTNFKNFLTQLQKLTHTLEVPVIAKEVGCGISPGTAKALMDAGVHIIDVAGAGGISWQKVEEERYLQQFQYENRFSSSALQELLNWGIPTTQCLTGIAALKAETQQYRNIGIIASGGISNGIDIAKAIALGADICASAGFMLKALHDSRLEETILTWMNDLRAVMFLTGAKDIKQLQQTRISLKKV